MRGPCCLSSLLIGLLFFCLFVHESMSHLWSSWSSGTGSRLPHVTQTNLLPHFYFFAIFWCSIVCDCVWLCLRMQMRVLSSTWISDSHFSVCILSNVISGYDRPSLTCGAPPTPWTRPSHQAIFSDSPLHSHKHVHFIKPSSGNLWDIYLGSCACLK